MKRQDVTPKIILLLALALLFGGMAAVGGSLLGQTREEEADMQEVARLVEQMQQPGTGDVRPEKSEEAEAPKPPKQEADGESPNESLPERLNEAQEEENLSLEFPIPLPIETDAPSAEDTKDLRANLASCKAQNADFIAWLRIPGTGIDYPVVWSDDTDYYLHHTFAGKESSVGTLISLRKTDYAAPSRNIAIYGHHLRTNNMFTPLLSYKRKSFWQAHDIVTLDSLYHSGTYRIFAAMNMSIADWDPSTASFPDDAAFMDFVERAKALSFYDTGMSVSPDDEILTLITCDRGFAGADGRLVVMAVRQ